MSDNTVTLTEEELLELLIIYGRATGVSYYLDEMAGDFNSQEEEEKFQKKWKELFGEEI